jgi:hypothetical protein
MPLTLPSPPDLGDDFWAQPEIVAAVWAGQIDLFLLAYRGARKARYSQDQIARWLCRSQGTVSAMESGKAPVSPSQVYDIFRTLKAPPSIAMAWGSGENTPRGGTAAVPGAGPREAAHGDPRAERRRTSKLMRRGDE